MFENKPKEIELMNEITNKPIICPLFQLTDEIVSYVKQFNSDEDFLRKGGLSTEMLDRLAFGFADIDITTLNPNQLSIKWKEDLENVKYEIQKSGLNPKVWASKINLTEPIDVSYERNNFFIEDGHHRFVAAKILNKPLNVNLEIKANPITSIAPKLGYDDVMRCIFKQVNEKESLNESNNYFNNKPYYHGGDEIINKFIKTEPKNRISNIEGFYFTDNINIAKKYGNKITTVHLTIQNPFYIHKTIPNEKILEKYKELLIKENPNVDIEWIDEKVDFFIKNKIIYPTGMSGENLKKCFIAGGYDSVIDGFEICVFNENNIIYNEKNINENIYPMEIKGMYADGKLVGEFNSVKYIEDRLVMKNKLNESNSQVDNMSINHNTLKNILNKAEIKNNLNVSYKNNSHYWNIDGRYFRVSDHDKPKGSFGYDSYKNGENDGDFRDYNSFFNFLNKEYDLTDKTKRKEDFYNKNKELLTRSDKLGVSILTPDGKYFSDEESALNSMYRQYVKQHPINESNSQLEDTFIKINSPNIKSHVDSLINKYGDKAEVMNYIKQSDEETDKPEYSISYTYCKKLISLANNLKDKHSVDKDKFELYGGFQLINYLSKELTNKRDSISRSKKTKTMIGFNNQYRKKHHKTGLVKDAKKYVDGNLRECIELIKESEQVKVNKEASCIVLLNTDKKILLLKRSETTTWEPGKWSLVGGKIDLGENAEQAAIRECGEETGLGIKGNKLIYCFTMKEDDYEVNFFIGVSEGSDVRINGEHTEFKWVTPNEIPELETVPNLLGEIKKCFETLGQSNDEETVINEEFNKAEYLKWKRNNVTYRGIKELGQDNNVYGSFGKGLYTVPASNKPMAKSYGSLYFVVNGIPKKPKVVNSLNDAEMVRQTLIDNYCKENNNGKYNRGFFDNNTSMDIEMLKLGYDGLIIKGREMVNYKPENDKIKYFSNENQLIKYYEDFIENKEKNVINEEIKDVHNSGDYRITINNEVNPTHITLFYENKKVGGLNCRIYSKSFEFCDGKTYDYYYINHVDINEIHQGLGYGKKMYKLLETHRSDNVKGIVSYTPDRVNYKQIPSIYKRYTNIEEGDYHVIIFDKTILESEYKNYYRLGKKTMWLTLDGYNDETKYKINIKDYNLIDVYDEDFSTLLDEFTGEEDSLIYDYFEEPTKELIDFYSSKGYDGFKNGEDLYIFDKKLKNNINENLLTEKLANVDEDVDILYDLYFKDDVDEIQRTGIITKSMFQRNETDTSLLKTEESVNGNEINPCKIVVNNGSNYYKPSVSTISISINNNALNYVLYDFKGNLKSANENLKGYDGYNRLPIEFTEHRIKVSIHHELAHWLDDSLNNKHLTKRIEKQTKLNTQHINGIPVNATKVEIQGIIHNIKQYYNLHKDDYNELTLSDLFKKIPSLNVVLKQLKSPFLEQWLKDLVVRMNREGLLGKNMRLNNSNNLV